MSFKYCSKQMGRVESEKLMGRVLSITFEMASIYYTVHNGNIKLGPIASFSYPPLPPFTLILLYSQYYII